MLWKSLNAKVVHLFHMSAAFVTSDKPTLTDHYHPNSIVYRKLYIPCTIDKSFVHSMYKMNVQMNCTFHVQFDKCLMTYIHH